MPAKNSPIRAVIFDMDGLLLDTEALYKEAMERACVEVGFAMSHELHISLIGVPAMIGNQLMRDALGEKFPLDEFNACVRKTMIALTRQGVPVKPGALALLRELGARKIPAAVATSTGRPLAPERLEKAGLLSHMSAVITSSDVTKGKPHPEPFLTAAIAVNTAPSDCLALEDSYNGIRSAHGAGMRAVMVPDLLPPLAEISELCHAILPSLDEVRTTFFGT